MLLVVEKSVFKVEISPVPVTAQMAITGKRSVVHPDLQVTSSISC